MSNGCLLPRGRKYLVEVFYKVCEFRFCGVPVPYGRDRLTPFQSFFFKIVFPLITNVLEW